MVIHRMTFDIAVRSDRAGDFYDLQNAIRKSILNTDGVCGVEADGNNCLRVNGVDASAVITHQVAHGRMWDDQPPKKGGE